MFSFGIRHQLLSWSDPFSLARILIRLSDCLKLSKTCAHSSIPITGTSLVRALLFSTDSTAYFSSSVYSRSVPFLVPIILSVHSALGFCYEPVSLNVPVTHYGISLERYLLCHTYDAFTPIAFLQCNLLDSYIRKFVNSLRNILTIADL